MAKAKQIKWDQPASGPVILVSGGEDFLASRVLREIRDSLRKISPQLEISEVDAGEYEAGRLIELTAPSLFDEPRLVIVSGVERCTDALIEDGLAYLVDINDESTVVFRHASGVRGKKLLDAIRNFDHATEVSCERIIKEADRTAFATGEFKAAGRKATHQAIRDLVAAFGEDTAGLAAACNQLLQDSADTIDEKIVDKYFGGKVEVDTFKVIDAAVAGDIATALTLLRHALESGQDAVSMVGAAGHKVRMMAKAINNRSVTAAQLGTNSSWLADKARKDVAGWTEEGMANVVREVARADAAAKGGERDPNYAIERLFMLIARKGIALD